MVHFLRRYSTPPSASQCNTYNSVLSDALSCRFTNGTYASQCNTYPGVAKRCTGAFLASLQNTPICVATQYRLLRLLATRSSREASLNLERRRLATYVATVAIAVAKRRYNLKFGPSLMAQYVIVAVTVIFASFQPFP
mgnify:FL=1